nr:MAG TPA: hypothetical protein [Caudoviricetes sp.]
MTHRKIHRTPLLRNRLRSNGRCRLRSLIRNRNQTVKTTPLTLNDISRRYQSSDLVLQDTQIANRNIQLRTKLLRGHLIPNRNRRKRRPKSSLLARHINGKTRTNLNTLTRNTPSHSLNQNLFFYKLNKTASVLTKIHIRTIRNDQLAKLIRAVTTKCACQ